MGIKLSDFIKDPHNVFTQEEAEMIYLAAGYVDLSDGKSSEHYQTEAVYMKITALKALE